MYGICKLNSCNADGQCPINMLCEGGSCRNRPRCNDDGKCLAHPISGEPQMCVRVSKDSCLQTEHCGRFCKPNQCSRHLDCPFPGWACIKGKCESYRVQDCSNLNDCLEHEKCINRYCLPHICWNDGVCNGQMICKDGICRPDPTSNSCSKRRKCKHPETCIDGKCILVCFVHKDCQSSSGQCRNDSCVCGANQRCTNRPNCNNEGKTCQGFDNLICLNKRCNDLSQIRCQHDHDCPIGYCRNDICVNTCRFHYDCPKGHICSSNGCVKNECENDGMDNVCGTLNMVCDERRCKRRCNNDFECGLAEFCDDTDRFCKQKSCNPASDDCKSLQINNVCNKDKNICMRCHNNKTQCRWCHSYKDCNYSQGEACTFGVCEKCPLDKCTKCEKDFNSCPQQHQCIEGRCQPRQCGASIYDCSLSERCSQGVCIQPGEECSNQKTCKKDGEVCVYGKCVDKCNVYGINCAIAKSCDKDNPCSPETTCKDGICIPRMRCDLDEDCNEGMACENGYCFPKQCFESEECYSAITDKTFICFENKCRNGECQSQDDCPSLAYECHEKRCIKTGCNNCRGNEVCDRDRCTLQRCLADVIWCATGKECFDQFCKIPCHEHVHCFTSGMMCDKSRGHCVPKHCRSTKDCPTNTSCTNKVCKIKYELSCFSPKQCCQKYPNVPVHCFRGQCTPWMPSGLRHDLAHDENTKCIVCDCPSVHSCKYVKGSVSCSWTQKECNDTGLCGVSCIGDHDCGKIATVRCMGGVGYDGICVPELSCRGSTQSITSNERVSGENM